MRFYYTNQLTSRDVPGTNDIIGAAIATAAVTVNGNTAWRHGEYFQKEVTAPNTAAPQYPQITVASGQTNVTGNILVSKTPQTFKYDADGNLTNDSLWNYTWDAENRPITIESLSTVPADARKREQWSYPN